MRMSRLPPFLAVEDKISYVDHVIPPVFEPLPSGEFELGGNRYELQSAERPWSAQRASNRQSLLRFEVREGDKWSPEVHRAVNRSEIYSRDKPLYRIGDDVHVAGQFKFVQGDVSPPTNFFGIFQLKSVHLNEPTYRDPGTTPAIVAIIQPDLKLSLQTRHIPLAPPDNRYEQGVVPPAVRAQVPLAGIGKWNYIYLRAKLGLSDEAELEFWFNGARIVVLTGLNIGISDREHYVKFGIYRTSIVPGESPSIVEWANIEHGLQDLSDRALKPAPIR